MPGPDVRVATSADREAIVDTVLAAFVADPAFRYFFPTDASYAEETRLFVGELLDQRLAFGTVWVVEDGAAVSMWNPPGPTHAALPAGLSAETAGRINRFDAQVRDLMPADPHWYLGIVATHPDHGGRGWGRLAMEPGLERSRTDGRPAYLETVTAVNVGIYERYGWRLAATTQVDQIEVRIMRNP
ncbi:MAG: GNAT family N-acetyltransferase [Actinomycetales bacterium]